MRELRKNKKEQTLLVCSCAKGEGLELLKNFEHLFEPCVSFITPSEAWRAESYKSVALPTQLGNIRMPNTITFNLFILGPIDKEYSKNYAPKIKGFLDSFDEKVRSPFIDRWIDYINDLGLSITEKQQRQAQDHITQVCAFFGKVLYVLAGSLWGQKLIQKKGWKYLGVWYASKVEDFILNDERVYLGNYELYNKLEKRFILLAEHRLGIELPRFPS